MQTATLNRPANPADRDAAIRVVPNPQSGAGRYEPAAGPDDIAERAERLIREAQSARIDGGQTAGSDKRIGDEQSGGSGERIKPRRRWRRSARAAAPKPPRAAPLAAVRGAAPRRESRIGYRVEEAIGYLAPLAALGVAGYYQAATAHDVLGWPFGVAWILSVSIEGAAARAAILFERHLIAGDGTMALRLGMLAYAGASSLLIGWHADATGKPWEIGLALGFMTLSAIWLWGRNGKWKRREEMRAKGLIDSRLPRFSAARWIACPIETPGALRYAVKYSISEPDRALKEYREHREATAIRQREERQAEANRKAGLARQSDARIEQADPADQVPQTAAADQPDQIADREQITPPAPARIKARTVKPQTARIKPGSKRGSGGRIAAAPGTDQPANVRPIDAARYADDVTAVRAEMVRQRVTGLPTNMFIRDAVIGLRGSCGGDKAQKIRELLKAESERDEALAN